jgi:type IV pilus assembly protein PilX
MSDRRTHTTTGDTGSKQRGMVLISSLLLLMVVTIFAMSMFRSFGVEERIAGNTRDKERARSAANTALQYAEWWITQNNWTNTTTCAPAVLVAPTQGQICNPPQLPNVFNIVALNAAVPNVANVPWLSGVQEIGTKYTPPGMNVTNAAAADYYFGPPRFYISYINNFYLGSHCGNVYQVDAWAYGGSPNTVAVVESQFEITWAGCINPQS